ncbi:MULTISPECIES: WXG100 family type VII secretion target [Mycobacteriaceae]|uniref:ESAT-6-like protein n=3 Tax=Mycobacteriaceae TaxID=1762 RepID=A0A1Y0CDR5_9MYCO|nr:MULTISPECIES: WXG100 family type VII secretion target [Mycobacteriaceae]ART73204.1 WXG100 family type VII secretion target [Mycobacterium dioxanotrophicus]MCV7160557.1 WXG100 family type VII secretion target [Mycolicibacterium brisbanense]OBC02034.1 type VII secretion protein EsxB [Mycobacterium sp. 852013-50091_SCH5140682]ORA36325.1 WXG100 family type VII secretion target [Mycobacterium aquaticum]GAS89012.1 10 kDa culture filtrate antigen EsxB, CFP-10 [Mycolicibacterium brisbanense]
MAMNTDVAVLAKEAGNFERISGELQSVIAQVESTGSTLASQMVGQAGTAAQAALARFHEAAAKQVQELNDISQNIHQSGTQYSSTDDDQASSLSSAMNI